MKKWLKVTLISSVLLLLLGIGGFFIWKYFFDKLIRPANYPTIKNFTLDEINSAISENSNAFNAKYICIIDEKTKDTIHDNKLSIIGIKGKITKIDKTGKPVVEMSNDNLTVIFSWDMEHRADEFKQLKENELVNLKGIITGFIGFDKPMSDDPMEIFSQRTVYMNLSCFNN